MEKEFHFSAMQWVLVRNGYDDKWTLGQFSHYDNDKVFHYVLSGGNSYKYCIPYKGNKFLRGNTDAYIESYIPKDGEFVYLECLSGEKYIFIKKDGSFITDRYVSYRISIGGTFTNSDSHVCTKDNIKLIRPATEDEKNMLISKLNEKGENWDYIKKDIVKYKWIPKKGEDYFSPVYDNEADKFVCNNFSWHNPDFHKDRLDKGWVFKTKEECQIMCNKLNEAIKNINV